MTIEELIDKLKEFSETDEVKVWIIKSEDDNKILNIQKVDDIVWIEIE